MFDVAILRSGDRLLCTEDTRRAVDKNSNGHP